ncbi:MULTISPECIES: DUF1003 domain-containing protein [unclassified Sphingomonas]|uniref:DUF1003 domain-containing protein n=1 Tax=unclassified Sphingomonas TaxID=196159 RepID=UPI002269BAC6|nr:MULTISPECIES: DUF1003 domain-containing protein [unclassified Sphingomonas]
MASAVRISATALAEMAHRLLGKKPAELDEEERRVLAGIESGRTVSRDAADVADERSDFGDRLSDKVAAIGGSWGFIIAFTVVLLGWMLLNSDVLAHFGAAFDPYPYIFLNLMLSTVAAIQAPVIMMSQNRQSAKDRLAASLDYETNLRSELDILRVHEKLDHIVLDRLAALEAKIDALAKSPPTS